MAQRPSSSTQAKIMPRLSASLSKLRKQWLSSVADLEPQAALAVLRQRLQSETDGAVRLGNMAAQSWIIRQRLIGLQTVLHGAPAVAVDEPSLGAAEDTPETLAETSPPDGQVAPQDASDPVAPTEIPGWTKLRILAETEANGMRFFEGTTIQVRDYDARKLIEAKSAEAVDAGPEATPAKPAQATKAAQKK